MKYASGQVMMVGDAVLADGMNGVIVCDFDNHEFAVGYGQWDLSDAMLGNEAVNAGVMVETKEAGLIHYPPGTGGIELIQPS